MDPAQAIIDALTASGVVLTPDQENAIKRLTPAREASETKLQTIQETIENFKQLNDTLDDGNNKIIRTNELFNLQRQETQLALELAKKQMINEGEISTELLNKYEILRDINAERGDQLELLDKELNKISMIGDELERLEKIRLGAGEFEIFGAQSAAKVSAYIDLLKEDISNLFDFSGERGTTNKFFETLTADISQRTQRMVKSYLKATLSEGKKMIFELSQAQADFNKEFGFGPVYTERIRTTYKELNEYGVTLKRVTEAQNSLIRTVTDFTMMNDTQQQILIDQVAILSGLGVSAEASTKGIQASMAIFGQTGPQAVESMSEIAATARFLGMSQTEVANAFVSSAGSLAKFGDDGHKVFKDLQRVFKLTGLEMEKVLNITNRFDTFVGAAEQAGKLNAALGGNFVNAMDLMMATDPVERFETIRNAILDTGLSFDDMSYYQQIFYKDALGLSDIGDLAMLLRGNINSLAGATNQSAESLIEQKERAQAALSVQEAFAAIIAQNAEELIDFAKYLTIFVQGLLDMADAIKILLPFLASYAIAQSAAAFATMLTGGALGGSLFKFLAFAAALTVIAAAFMFSSPSALVVAMFALGIAMVALGVAASFASGPIATVALPILGVGAALLMAGAAIYLMTAGLGEMSKSFAELLDVIDPAQIFALSFSLQSLAIGLGTLALFGAPGITALAAVGVAAIGLGFALILVGDKIEIFSNMINGLVELSNVASELSIVAKEINNIADAIDKIPEKKALAVSTAMRNTTVAANTLAAAGGGGNATTAPAATTTITRQPIQLFIDKDKMSEVVLDIVGGQVMKVIQQTG